MERSKTIEKILPAFERYYTIKKDEVTQPFCAEAEFRSHNEQYFLVRSAHIADLDSNEFVFFADCEELTEELLSDFVTTTWETGLSRVRPHSGHRNSDISLIIFTEKISDEVKIKIKKTKLYKSYKFSFHGWSNFKLAVCSLSEMTAYSNRHGKDFAKLIIKNIKNP